MGTQGSMSRSLRKSANFIFKIHITALESQTPTIQLYPVMDGLYVVSDHQGDMLDFLERMFSRLADLFVSTPDMQHRFIVKGSLAYGPVVHGSSLLPAASATLVNNQNYRNALLLGMPMIQAYLGEKKAPPFGVFVNESARAFCPAGAPAVHPLTVSWWTWFRPGQWIALAQELRTEMNLYCDWCSQRSHAIDYPVEKIKEHRGLIMEYLADVPLPAPVVAPAPVPAAAP